jgi:integrase
VKQTRWVANYTDPLSGKRRQQFFETHKAAVARRSELVEMVATDTYVDRRSAPTIEQALDHWLDDKRGKVKASTLAAHKVVVAHIRSDLGRVKVSDLTTADIRILHRQLSERSGAYTANRAKSHLRSIMALAEEDFRVRAPTMPEGLGRGRQRTRKAILMPDQIAAIIAEAREDERGIYYAFPFLAGTRPSEQLGLLWEDVDFEAGTIRIRRIQERDGTLTEMTKTEAGTREVPMGATLRELLLNWRVRCPRVNGELHRVFPGPGRMEPWPKPRSGGGGPLLYQNFRRRYWQPVFKKLGLPYVTPHSARHSYISTMQAAGVEVGLVAKLAGHASAMVTLGHYTQAVRGGGEAVEALEKAYKKESAA